MTLIGRIVLTIPLLPVAAVYLVIDCFRRSRRGRFDFPS